MTPSLDRLASEGLRDGVVDLRRLVVDDATWIADARHDDEVVRYTDITDDLGVADATAWIERRVVGWEQGWRASFVVRTAAMESAGYVNLRMSWGRGVGEIGWWLRERFRGRGLMTAAVRLVRDAAFDELDLARLEMTVQPANTASIGVCERLGAQREGLLRSSDVLKGIRHDHWLFALLATDPRI